MNEELVEDKSKRAYLHKDGRTYSYEKVLYKDLKDVPSLPRTVRSQVARWAHNAGVASREQKILLGAKALAKTEREKAILADKALKECKGQLMALNISDEEEKLRLMRPQNSQGLEMNFPISIEDAANILGVNSGVLQNWDALGIVVAPRWGNGHFKGYFHHQLYMAVMVKKALISGYSLTQVRAALGLIPMPETDSLIALQTLKQNWQEALISI